MREKQELSSCGVFAIIPPGSRFAPQPPTSDLPSITGRAPFEFDRMLAEALLALGARRLSQ